MDPVMDVAAAVEDPQRWNRYSYVRNSPFQFTDPDGRSLKLLTLTLKVAHAVYKGYDVYSTVEGIVESASTLASGDATGRERGLAALALAGELSGATDLLKAGRVLRATDSKGAFEVAAEGGRHAGFLREYAQKSVGELRRAAKSFEENIALHLDKIRNPGKHIEGFSKLDPRQQKNLIEVKWPGDIRKAQEQLEIVRRILTGADKP